MNDSKQANASQSGPERFIGANAQLDFVVLQEDQKKFAEISGDYNPLHLSDEFARSMGLDRAVVYGALIVAKISNILGMDLPGKDGIWSALEIDFRSPLYVGQTASITAEVDHVSAATRTISIKFTVTCNDIRIATATALSTLHQR